MLGRAAEYAIFATLYIAKNDERGPVQGRAIADSYGIRPEYLLKILQRLVRARIIRSERGRNGGFRQLKPPAQTTLLEIVEAAEGPLKPEPREPIEVTDSDGSKELIQDVCGEIAEYTRSLLSRTTVSQLVEATPPSPLRLQPIRPDPVGPVNSH